MTGAVSENVIAPEKTLGRLDSPRSVAVTLELLVSVALKFSVNVAAEATDAAQKSAAAKVKERNIRSPFF